MIQFILVVNILFSLADKVYSQEFTLPMIGDADVLDLYLQAKVETEKIKVQIKKVRSQLNNLIDSKETMRKLLEKNSIPLWEYKNYELNLQLSQFDLTILDLENVRWQKRAAIYHKQSYEKGDYKSFWLEVWKLMEKIAEVKVARAEAELKYYYEFQEALNNMQDEVLEKQRVSDRIFQLKLNLEEARRQSHIYQQATSDFKTRI